MGPDPRVVPAKEEGVLFDGEGQAGCSGKAWPLVRSPGKLGMLTSPSARLPGQGYVFNILDLQTGGVVEEVNAPMKFFRLVNNQMGKPQVHPKMPRRGLTVPRDLLACLLGLLNPITLLSAVGP